MLNKRLAESTLRLKWKRSPEGYDISPCGSGRADTKRNEDDPQFVIPRGTSVMAYDVGLGEKRIFLDVLNMKRTLDGVLAFAKKWGLLHDRQTSVGEFYQLHDRMHDAFVIGGAHAVTRLLDPRTGLAPVGTADICVSLKPGSRASDLLWYVSDLHCFCILEAWRELGGAAEVVTCAQCGQYFTKRGRGPAPKTCSDKCRTAKSRRTAKRSAQDGYVGDGFQRSATITRDTFKNSTFGLDMIATTVIPQGDERCLSEAGVAVATCPTGWLVG